MGANTCKPGAEEPVVPPPPEQKWKDPKQASAAAAEWDRSVEERAAVDGKSERVLRKRNFVNPNARVCTDATGITNWNALKDFNSVSMDEIIRQAQTGDIILFDNDVMLGTCLIGCMTRSDWDHTGVVIRFPEPIGVRLLEAVAPRVVMDRLDLVVSQVKSGDMYWRQLKRVDGTPLWTEEEENSIRVKAQSLYDRPYEGNVDEMVNAWVAGEATTWDDAFGVKGACCDKRYNEENKKKEPKGLEGEVNTHVVETDTEQKLFCSECVAAIYKHAGLISEEEEACNFLPKDFSTDPHASLALNDHFELSDEKRILHYKAGEGGPVDSNGLPVQQ